MLSARVVPEAITVFPPVVMATAVGSHILKSDGCKRLSHEGTCMAAKATVTKYHRMGGLNNTNLLSLNCKD